jgi:hypothetical protein
MRFLCLGLVLILWPGGVCVALADLRARAREQLSFGAYHAARRHPQQDFGPADQVPGSGQAGQGLATRGLSL